MKDKIKIALKQAYKNLGLGEKAFDGVASFLEKTITEDSQINDAVNSAEMLLKSIQGEVDRERSSRAILQKELDGLKAKIEKTPPNPPKEGDPKPNNSSDSELAKEIAELKAKLDAMEQGQARSSFVSNVEAMLTEKKVPKSYISSILKGRSFGEQDTVEAVVEEIQNEYKVFEEELAKDRFGGSIPPEKSDDPVDEIQSFAEAIDESNKKFFN